MILAKFQSKINFFKNDISLNNIEVAMRKHYNSTFCKNALATLIAILMIGACFYSPAQAQSIRQELDKARSLELMERTPVNSNLEAVRVAAEEIQRKLAPYLNINPTDPVKSFRLSGANLPSFDINSIISSNASIPAVEFVRHSVYGTPRYMSNILHNFEKYSNTDNMQASDKAMLFFNANKELMRLATPVEELSLADATTDLDGNKHLRYEQFYQGIPVWGKEITVHFDKGGKLYHINSIYAPTPEINVHSAILQDNDAISAAEKDLLKSTNQTSINKQELESFCSLLNYQGPSAEKVIWHDDKTGAPYLAWKVEIRPNIISLWRYFIDAKTGAILEKYNAAKHDGGVTGQGIDLNGVNRTLNVFLENNVYYMLDVSRAMFKSSDPNNPKGIILSLNNKYTDLNQQSNPTVFQNYNNQWSDPAAVSIHYSMGQVYEYYRTTHGRNSIDNNGMNIVSVIHVTSQGQGYDNAYWNGQFMVYGDGGTYFKPLPGALDVVAHEMTHGVVEFTVGLEYKFQSGALDEAFADWGGAMVDRDNWLIGEKIVKLQHYPSGAMRDMENPHNGGTKNDHYWLPAHMNEYQEMDISDDNGGVHVNCGIINKVTSLIGNAIGKDKLEKIYYRVLANRYLNKQSQFVDMRLAAIKSATELYGASSNETNAVRTAFTAVGLLGDDPTQPNDDIPPVVGQEWIAMVDAVGKNLHIAKPKIQNMQTDVVKLTNTTVSVANGCVITAPENGSYILFIDGQNKLRGIKPDGTDEQYISNEAIWRSISISPDGNKIALTSTNNDNYIHIIDLTNSSLKSIELYMPSTSHSQDYSFPLWANNLSWNLDNRHLAYDAVNFKFKLNGDMSIYMDMNLLDAESGMIYRLFPPFPDGIHIGAPVFSQTSEYPLLFNVYNEENGNYIIAAVDLFSGDVGSIGQFNENQLVVSSPFYSVNDRRVVFQAYVPQSGVYTLMQIPLMDNKIQPSGGFEAYLSGAAIPKWFAVGSRPSTVTNEPVKIDFANYPNPFSQNTLVSFDLKAEGYVTLEIFDSRGNKVSIPVDNKFYNAGYYVADFNGRDSGGNLLSTGSYVARLTITSNGKINSFNRAMILVR